MDTQPLTRPNPSSGTPVYLQLVEQVRRRLASGALQPGEALPGVAPLAEALVVHPASVARAYRELEARRLAVRSGGVLRASCQPPALPPAPGAAGHPADGWPGLACELDAARDVQRCLLPSACAGVDGLDYAGVSRAAHGVTGDYYHFAPLPGHRLAIAIGDVCGKGVPAALGMAALRAYLHGATARHQADPRALVTMVNDLVYASVPVGRFATLFYGVYDLRTRTLAYVNAGHLPPVRLRPRDGNRREHLTAGGPALGLMPGARYAAERVVLESGDLLAAYTDGISEALNAAGDEWGDDRVLALLERSARCGARDIVETVLAAADAFAHGASQHDDMTVAVVRVIEQPVVRVMAAFDPRSIPGATPPRKFRAAGTPGGGVAPPSDIARYLQPPHRAHHARRGPRPSSRLPPHRAESARRGPRLARRASRASRCCAMTFTTGC